MSPRNTGGLVRLGVLALPLAGLLALVGLYSTFKLGPGGILATGDNQAIVSSGYFLGVFLGNVLALTVLIFGVIALYAYFSKQQRECFGFWRDAIEHRWDRSNPDPRRGYCLHYPCP
jgi:hypothetical protein